MTHITIVRGRTKTLTVKLSYPVDGDTLTSQIRVNQDPTSQLIATWQVDFKTDGTDGELVLTLDDVVTAAITQSMGFMDIKRVSDGEPLDVFDERLTVVIVNPVTA